MLVKMKGERNPHTLLVGMKISSVTMGIIMEASQKAKVKLLCYSAIGFLGTLKKNEAYFRDNYRSIFIMALFTIPKLWNHPRCPSTDEQVEKVTHTHTTYKVQFYSVIKRMKLCHFWKMFGIIMLRKINQSHKDKCHIRSLICVIRKGKRK
jgi:hypothetical protein